MFICFNTPHNDLIVDFLLKAFRSASRGSKVCGSVMSWSDIETTEALENIRENRNLEYNFAAGKEGADIKPEIRKFFFITQ